MQPKGYTLKLTSFLNVNVPCEAKDNVINAFLGKAETTLPCLVQNGKCTINVDINNCVMSRRKRATVPIRSSMIVVLSIPLGSTDSFDLPKYYTDLQSKFDLNKNDYFSTHWTNKFFFICLFLCVRSFVRTLFFV